MSEYKSIHGVKVRDYTTDPDNLITGQVWYDKTNKVLQFQAAGAGAWATGGNLNLARQKITGCGTQTAALAAGGDSSGIKDETELYNGSTWTEVNNLTTGRKDFSTVGSQTSAIAMAGQASPGHTVNVETWNGTSWT